MRLDGAPHSSAPKALKAPDGACRVQVPKDRTQPGGREFNSPNERLWNGCKAAIDRNADVLGRALAAYPAAIDPSNPMNREISRTCAMAEHFGFRLDCPGRRRDDTGQAVMRRLVE
jgi:hypothetical protein